MKILDKDNMNIGKHIEYLAQAATNNWGLKSHGFIYKVISGFTANMSRCKYIKDGKVLREEFDTCDFRVYETKYIKEGTLIEFRCEYDAHCRDIDNDYWRIDASILALKCVPYAKIHEKVRFANNLNLKEILDNKHYDLLEGDTNED